jgi:hypothetical protein
MTKPKRTIAAIRKGSRNVLVVTVSQQRGQVPSIDIRQHEPNGKRELIPTMKGISNIDPSVARALVVALEKTLSGLDASAVQP